MKLGHRALVMVVLGLERHVLVACIWRSEMCSASLEHTFWLEKEGEKIRGRETASS